MRSHNGLQEMGPGRDVYILNISDDHQNRTPLMYEYLEVLQNGLLEFNIELVSNGYSFFILLHFYLNSWTNLLIIFTERVALKSGCSIAILGPWVQTLEITIVQSRGKIAYMSSSQTFLCGSLVYWISFFSQKKIKALKMTWTGNIYKEDNSLQIILLCLATNSL